MQRANFPLTLALGAVLATACARLGLAQPAAAAAAEPAQTDPKPTGIEPGGPPTPEHVAKADAALAALLERYQPPGGRDKSSPNAFEPLIAALEAWTAVKKKLPPPKADTPEENITEPDFNLICSSDPQDPNSTAYKYAMNSLVAHRESDLTKHLDAMATMKRAVQPARGTADYERLLLATGLTKEEATETPGYLIDDYTGVKYSKILREIFQYNSAVMRLAAREGDTATLLRVLEQTLAIARVRSQTITPIDQLSAIAIVSESAFDVGWLLEQAFTSPNSGFSEKLTSPEFLAAVSGPFTRQLSELPPFSAAWEYEQLQFVDTVPQVYGQGDKALPEGTAIDWIRGVKSVVSKPLPSRAREIAKAESMFAAAIAVADMPWPQAREALPKFEGNGEFSPDDSTPLLKVMQPAIRNMQVSRVQSLARVAGLRTMLAIRLHQLKTGALPKSLAEIPDLDPAISTDPYTGQQLGYRVLDANHFELWSGGGDAKDNGGVFDKTDPLGAAGPYARQLGKDFKVFPRPY